MSLCRRSRQQAREFFGRRPSLQRQGEALVVVSSFPGPEADRGRGEVVESLTAPELLVVNAMTALHLAVLLGAPGLDVAVPDPERLHGERKGEGKLMPVVALKLPDRERKRAAELAQKRQARALVQPAIEPQDAKPCAVIEGGVLKGQPRSS